MFSVLLSTGNLWMSETEQLLANRKEITIIPPRQRLLDSQLREMFFNPDNILRHFASLSPPIWFLLGAPNNKSVFPFLMLKDNGKKKCKHHFKNQIKRKSVYIIDRFKYLWLKSSFKYCPVHIFLSCQTKI